MPSSVSITIETKWRWWAKPAIVVCALFRSVKTAEWVFNRAMKYRVGKTGRWTVLNLDIKLEECMDGDVQTDK